MSDELRHIIEAPIDQSVAVRAGPGGGKTYLIAQRAAYLLKSNLRRNSQIGCITYTNSSIEELEIELIPKHFTSKPRELFLGTIHSFLIDYILRPYGHFLPDIPDDFKLTPPDGYANRFLPTWMKKDMPTYRIPLFESVGYQIDGELICYHVSRGWSPTARQMRVFKDQMHRAGYIDLYDVLYFSWRILSQFPFVADCLTARFVSILVDEFQDTTVIQNAILEVFQKSNRTSLFLVGDPDQSIFSFAGAVPETFREHLSSSLFYCESCGQTEHRILINRRCSRRILDFLNGLSTMPGGQTVFEACPWKEYPIAVRILIPCQQPAASQHSQLHQDALEHFFSLIRDQGIDADVEESFCILAYENKLVANLQALHARENPGPDSLLDDLKQSNRRLHRIVYDLLVAIKHKREGEWALAHEATERSLTRLLFDDANPRFCNYDDETVGLNRRVWPAVVWTVMDQLEVGDSQTLLAWCKALKEPVHRAVRLAGGQSVRQSKLGILDCRGARTGKLAQNCQIENELNAVIRPNLIGDSFRTIHRAKGIQRDAVMVFAKDTREVDKWLFSSDISQDESSRRGFVAFSRARKILCIYCESLSTEQKQQLEEKALEIVYLGQRQLALF